MPISCTLDTRLHPFKALRAVQRLLKCPDDTRQVFVVLSAMRGRSGLRLFHRFRASPVGAAILRERRALLVQLRDRDALARLPQGSLGREYLAFMTAENLSGDALADMSKAAGRPAAPEEEAIFRDRMRDMHDLAHVVTSYGREPLGELCLIAFNYAQSRHLGMAMIALLGMARIGRGPSARAARKAVMEGWRRGRAASWLPGQDWENMLSQPVAALRRQLRIADAPRYLGASL